MISCPQELPYIYEAMKVSLILTAPFLFYASMLPERPIIRSVPLLVWRHYPAEFRARYLLKTQRRLGDLFAVQRSASAWPCPRPPLVEVADLFPGPSMDGVVAPIDVLVRRFLFHEIGQ